MAGVAPARRSAQGRWVAAAALLLLAAGPGRVVAQELEPSKPTPEAKPDKPDAANPPPAETPTEEWYSIHGQATVISQGNWKFRSPYFGPNSLLSILNYRTTNTDTLYLDSRLWHGAEIVFNPEVSGGRGLSDTLGVAGFPNGDATRVGAVQPTPYVARLFLRQTFGLDGDVEKVESGPNQLAGVRDIDRITFTIGKLAATDIFDDNRYSHDPRTQFLNWSLMYDGAWDYPANTRGYTYGATADFNTRYLAARYGIFGEPADANGSEIDPRFLKAHGQIVEFEERYDVGGHPGKLREWAYANTAHMGKYREALAEMPVDPDVTRTRAYRTKYGFGVNVEQELATNLGVFLRAGWNDGQSESWAFTEIDQTVATGLNVRGALWSRPKDEAGLAFVCNGISDAHRDYLAAGGLGFIIGDGRLNYGFEEIVELYYNWVPKDWLIVSTDLQGVNNPAYNRDRGPVAIFAVRVHMSF
jgi:high affinity Mn2+ porin